MTNTSSNSVSSRRNIFNSAASAHLASMSNSSSSTYPASNTMPNPPPAMLSGQISAPYSRPTTITTYPLSISTSYASSSSTRAPYLSNYLQSSSTVTSTSNTSSKQSKLKIPKPKVPEYLADTSFAELYYNSNSSLFDKNSFENLALPTAWNVDDKCTHLSVDPDKLRVNYIGEIIGSLDLESM